MVEKLRDLVKERLALDLSRRDDPWISEIIDEQAKAAGVRGCVAYLERLRAEDSQGAAWSGLIDRLTIAETYFFRDEGQMTLLRDELLPALIKEAGGRRLRIQSAGCSTGEELYSIAMLLDGLGGPPSDLLGTDINPVVVEQARQGVFRERSLRTLPAALRASYLQPVGRGYRIIPRLRERTRFQVQNMAQDDVAPQRGLDLIVCRNVLIYFDRNVLPGILERFYSSLRPGGMLLTGHGELLTVDSPFTTVVYPSSLVYRRPDVATMSKLMTPTGSRFDLGPGAKPQTLVSLVNAPRPATSSGLTPSAPPVSSFQAPEETLDAEALSKLARAARLEGRTEEARILLRKALYQDPESALAFLEMALLLVDEDPARARKHHATALALIAEETARAGWTRSGLSSVLRELEGRLR